MWVAWCGNFGLAGGDLHGLVLISLDLLKASPFLCIGARCKATAAVEGRRVLSGHPAACAVPEGVGS